MMWNKITVNDKNGNEMVYIYIGKSANRDEFPKNQNRLSEFAKGLKECCTFTPLWNSVHTYIEYKF